MAYPRGSVFFALNLLVLAAPPVLAAGSPAIISVRPEYVRPEGGQRIYVTGENFAQGLKLFMGSIECEQVHVTGPTALECITPPHPAAQVRLVLQSPSGVFYSSPVTFHYRIDLEVSPRHVRTAVGKKAVFSASEGFPPYTYSVVQGEGKIDSRGAFTAPDSAGAGLVEARDSQGHVGYAYYSTYAAVRVVPDAQTMQTDEVVHFSATGGLPPYRAVLVSGGGRILDGSFMFASPSKAGKTVLRLYDSLGNSAETTITYLEAEAASRELGVPYFAHRRVAVGNEHSCAIVGSDVLCWGSNAKGQLGNPSIKRNSTVPVKVWNLPEEVVSIASGLEHTCALLKGGALKCWGDNRYGQLGDGTKQDRREPVTVAGLDSSVTGVVAGDMFTCAIVFHELFCWGRNDAGQLGNGTRNHSALPVMVRGLGRRVSAVAAGSSHTCALESTRTVKCWGENSNGQLGRGDRESSLNAAPVIGLPDKVDALAAGWAHTCALANGGVKCWGFNGIGTLGQGNLNKDRSVAVDVAGLTAGVQMITGGQYHNCAISDGAVNCWGYNYQGQVGDSTLQNRAAPVPVQGLGASALDVATGSNHSCALLGDQQISCWGENYLGQLGDGGNVSRNVPAKVLLKKP